MVKYLTVRITLARADILLNTRQVERYSAESTMFIRRKAGRSPAGCRARGRCEDAVQFLRISDLFCRCLRSVSDSPVQGTEPNAAGSELYFLWLVGLALLVPDDTVDGERLLDWPCARPWSPEAERSAFADGICRR